MIYEKNADGSLMRKQNIAFEDHDNSHPHSVNISSDNKNLYIADLGHDRIWQFRLYSESGELIPLDTPYIQLAEGAGPRHFTFSLSEEFAYSINELNSTVSTFRRNEQGELEHLENVSSLPEGFQGENSAADIHLHPSGKFIYVSNRGHNSIASFRVDQENGTLENISFTSTEGESPRNFSIAPKGDFISVANQDSNNLVVLKIDLATGTLLDHNVDLEVKTPVCIELLR